MCYDLNPELSGPRILCLQLKAAVLDMVHLTYCIPGTGFPKTQVGEEESK